MRTANEANKEKFLKAAVSELKEHGVADFSIRRVAKKCGVSCAAPYKHFESKNALLEEVMRYIGKKWRDVLTSTVETHRDEPLKDRIVAICMAYIVFLCTYPEYCSVLCMSDTIFRPNSLSGNGNISAETSELIDKYCVEHWIDEDMKVRKYYVVRSLIFGGTKMITSGILPFDSKTLDMIKMNIVREFDLP